MKICLVGIPTSIFLILIQFSYAILGVPPEYKRQDRISPMFSSASSVRNLQIYVYLPLVMRPSGTIKGDVFYVSLEGKDTNPGSYFQPWKTIEKAAEMVSPGDTVYIREGIYTEAPKFTKSGTESEPINILAYPGETVVVDGMNELPLSYRGLVSIFGDWVQISGLEVRNSEFTGLGLYGNHNTANSIFAHHSQKAGIDLGGDYGIVENSLAWRNSMQNEFSSSSSWSPGLVAGNDATVGITEFAVLRRNVVWENWGEGINTNEANGTIIEDNISHDNFSTNIYISDATNVLCQRNFVYMNPESDVYDFGANGGIKMGDETYNPPSANINIINNIAFGNQGNFWWWQGVEGGGMNNVLIANNTFVNGIGDPDQGRGGVIISSGAHQNVQFKNNLVKQDDDLPVIATLDQPGITYSHNLWSKPPYSAASGAGDEIGDPMLAQLGDPYSSVWFRLTGLSPAIDKALLIPEIPDDYFGDSRDSSPDMGAIEYHPD